MKIDIVYDKKAEKFLKCNPHRITVEKTDALIQKAIQKLHGDRSVNVDVKALKGRSKGKYRIRTGDIRIIFYIERDAIIIVTVEDIDLRGEAYMMRENDAEYHPNL